MVVFFQRDIFRVSDDFFSKRSDNYSLGFEGTVISGWSEGKKQWEIKAKKIKVTKDERWTEFFDIFEGKFFKDKEVVGNFSAREGRWDKITNNLEISGSVQLKNKDTEIEGEGFIYTGSDKRLTSVGPIKFILKSGYLISQKIIAHQEKDEVELFENVGEFEVKEPPG